MAELPAWQNLDPSPPTGPAGGDLSGAYPNPTIAGAHGLTPGQVVIANAEGIATAQTVKGDATMDGTGALSLAKKGEAGGPALLNSKGALLSAITLAKSTAVGANALEALEAGATENTALGYRALHSEKTGSGNTALGAEALEAATAGGSNTAVGRWALATSSTGETNTAVGNGALRNLTTASRNVAIGASAMETSTTGQENVAVGRKALFKTTSGGNNVALGHEAGALLTVGSAGNVIIGHNAGPAAEEELSNRLYIGNAAGAEPLIWGNFSTKELRFFTTKLGFYGVAAVARAAAIASPAETLAALKTAVDKIREALKNVGLTE